MCVCGWGGGGGGGRGDYSVAYEATQSNRVSDFRDFVCSLFPKAILFDFYLKPSLLVAALSAGPQDANRIQF